eukprot:GHVQ01031166.1.p1 GENE.GHVQ01031166.1~~GHVQ01031166.1.p1  ORF type:complete len:162 (+),score=35.07 GHVQ01031166.1:804-1289(+)
MQIWLQTSMFALQGSMKQVAGTHMNINTVRLRHTSTSEQSARLSETRTTYKNTNIPRVCRHTYDSTYIPHLRNIYHIVTAHICTHHYPYNQHRVPALKTRIAVAVGSVRLLSVGAVELLSVGAVELLSVGAVELLSVGAVELLSVGAVGLLSVSASWAVAG